MASNQTLIFVITSLLKDKLWPCINILRKKQVYFFNDRFFPLCSLPLTNYHNKVSFIDSPCWLFTIVRWTDGRGWAFLGFHGCLFREFALLTRQPSTPSLHQSIHPYIHPPTRHHLHRNLHPLERLATMQLFWVNFIQSAFVYLQYIYALNDGVRLCHPSDLPASPSPLIIPTVKVSKCQSKDLKMGTLNVLYCGKRSLSMCVCTAFVDKLCYSGARCP